MSTPPPVPPDMPEIPGIPPMPAAPPEAPVDAPTIPPVPYAGPPIPAAGTPPLPPVPPQSPLDPLPPAAAQPGVLPPVSMGPPLSPPIPEATAHRAPGLPPASYPPVTPPQSSPGNSTKILIFGCLGLVLLGVVVIGAGLWWVGKKVKGIAENPEQFIAEMVISQHPELELVTVDKATKQVTLKDRNTGETTTVSFSDLEKGTFRMKKSDGTSVEMGPGGIATKDKDGNETVIGAGATMPLPEWVPAWEGAHQVVVSSRKTAAGQVTGNFAFTVSTGVDEAATTYQKQLEAAGFTVETEEVAAPQGKVFNLTAQAGPEGQERLVKVNCMSQDNTGSLVTLEYQGTTP